MSETLFKKVDYSMAKLMDDIEMGTIGLPDIQRPFVWKNAKVRDLFDSIFRGYQGARGQLGRDTPVQTGIPRSAKQIAISDVHFHRFENEKGAPGEGGLRIHSRLRPTLLRSTGIRVYCELPAALNEDFEVIHAEPYSKRYTADESTLMKHESWGSEIPDEGDKGQDWGCIYFYGLPDGAKRTGIECVFYLLPRDASKEATEGLHGVSADIR